MSMICIDDIEETMVEWLWYPRIPKGKITLIQGAPGSSKTTLLCQLIADMTTGTPFLGDNDTYSLNIPFEERKPLRVLYQITEDDFSDTIKPRLRKAGACMKQIFNIDEKEGALTFSDSRIGEAIREWNIDVAVFDPLMSYVGADTQLNMGNSARAIMNPLIKLGNETGCTFIIVAHTSKQTSAEAANRLIGSIDFVSSCRSLLTVGKDPHNPDVKALAHTKTNVGPIADTILYTLNHDGGGEGIVKYAGHSLLTSDEIIAPAEPRKKPSFALDDAKEFLLEIMKDGYAETKEVSAASKKAGINKNSLYKAKEELKIKSRQYGGGKNAKYWWIMPGKEPPKDNREIAETNEKI